MNIHLVKIFVTVFTEKSISRAAEKLYISQPTVTDHVKKLEDLIGEKLFIRINKGIKPTDYANMIFPKFAKLLNEYNNLIDFLEVKSNIDKKITIGTSSVPKIIFLSKVIDKLQEMTNVSFNIIASDSMDIIRKVLSYEIVLGFVGTVAKDEKLIFEKIMDDELVITAKKGFFQKSNLEIDDLLRHKAIMREEGSGTRKEIENYFKSAGISMKMLNIYVVVNDNNLYIDLIKMGLGYGFISKAVAELNGLSVHKLSGMSLKRGIFAVFRKNIELIEEYKILLEFCKNNIV